MNILEMIGFAIDLYGVITDLSDSIPSDITPPVWLFLRTSPEDKK
ncbi:hypothetical protein [Mesobacillus zeae]